MNIKYLILNKKATECAKKEKAIALPTEIRRRCNGFVFYFNDGSTARSAPAAAVTTAAAVAAV